MRKKKLHTRREKGSSFRTIKPALLTLAIAQALSLQAAQAATIEVTSSLDDGSDCTLRDAIVSVNNGALEAGCANTGSPFGTDDTINVAPGLASDTITLANGQLEINPGASVAINASGISVNANQQSRVFSVTPAIYVYLTLSIDDMTITGGSSSERGGGIAVNGYTGFGYSSPPSSIILSNITLSGNSADGSGGGIFATGSSLSVSHSTISGNSSGGSGGGVRMDNLSIINVNMSNIVGNFASSVGGGLSANYYSSIALEKSTVSGNSAVAGGGISARDVGSVFVNNSTVSENSASFGGGIAVDFLSDVRLTNSTISGNSAGTIGGGIDAFYSNIEMSNSTLSGNTAGSACGAIYNYGTSNAYSIPFYYYGDLFISDSTISENVAPETGGICIIAGATANLTNSIIANSSNHDCALDISTNTINGTPMFIADAASIIEDGSCVSSARAVDPMLESLSDNGCVDKHTAPGGQACVLTHALAAGSPAINTAFGSTVATDQIGTPRPQGGIADVGAYEFIAANNALSIEKLINNRARQTLGTAAQLLADSHYYRADYKVTNNGPDRLYEVQVFEGGQLVCDLYGLNPGQSKQKSHCASNQAVLVGSNNVPASVTAKVSGSSVELTSHTNAYYTGLSNISGGLNVTHYVNERNADTQAKAVAVNGNQAEVLFRVENTGSIELYRVNTFHDPASPVNSGWQQQCLIGTLLPGQVRHCKRTVNVTQEGLNKAYGRVQGSNANVGNTGSVNASNPTYFNLELP